MPEQPMDTGESGGSRPLHSTGHTILVQPEGNTTLRELLANRGIQVPAPCGGRGTCGKCKVRVLSGTCDPPRSSEHALLAPHELLAGYRLSCMCIPREPMEVAIELPSEGMVDKGNLQLYNTTMLDDQGACTRLECISIVPCEQGAATSTWKRFAHALGKTANLQPSLQVLTDLGSATANGTNRVQVCLQRNADSSWRTAAIEPLPHTDSRLLGCAIDIGTTTVAVHLMDLHALRLIGSVSETNAQARFGSDVITRIGACMKQGTRLLANTIQRQLDRLLGSLCKTHLQSRSDVRRIAVVGNPTMLHILLNVDPSGIAAAPFVPVFTHELELEASAIGLQAGFGAVVHLLPSVSAYVGADITAGIIASRLLDRCQTALLLDIGTNGEIVLKSGSRLYACATAAGPAFEGAGITCGVGGIEGAIDSWHLVDGIGKFTTIGKKRASGICGAGLVDIMATLLKAGKVNARGKMVLPDVAVPAPACIVARAEETEDGHPMVLTQKDVREIQLAKAAVMAGIMLLCNTAGIGIPDIEQVWLAGGFGSHLHPASACAIGLIPPQLAGKTESIGNAAGTGAIQVLCSHAKRTAARDIPDRCTYVELSTESAFQKLFMESMAFPSP